MMVGNGDYEHETAFSLKKRTVSEICTNYMYSYLTYSIQNFFPSSVEFVHLHSAISMVLNICTNTSKVRLID